MSTQAAAVDGQAPQAIQPQGGNLPASVFKNDGVDTSARALERNELGVKSGYEAPVDPSVVPQSPAAPPVEPQKGSEPASTPPTDGEKLLAGKYKSVEELEKGYIESQKGFMEKVKAEATKQAETLAEKRATEVLAEKLRGLVQPQQDANAITQVAQKSLANLSDDEHLDMLTKSPRDYIQMIQRETQQETLRALKAAQVKEAWARDNADLLQMQIAPAADGKEAITGESLISFMTLTLAQQRPELLNDGTGEAALRESTAIVRNLLSAQQNLGKQQAMVVRDTVTPLQATTTGTAAGDNRAPQAPAPSQIVDPVADEVERLRAEKVRVTRQPVTRL